MILHTQAPGRASLIGDPSDRYHGKAIGLSLRDLAARVTLYESPRLAILPGPRDHLVFQNRQALVEATFHQGFYGCSGLLKATIAAFDGYCQEHGIRLDDRNFTLEYTTDLPVRAALGGATALVTAAMRALTSFYGVTVPAPTLPTLIHRAVANHLGAWTHLSDSVPQVYEGAVFMDFGRERLEALGYGAYEVLPPEHLPPLFVAYLDAPASAPELAPHDDLQSLVRRRDPKVTDAMETLADYAQEAHDLLTAGRGHEIGVLLDASYDLCAKLLPIRDGDRRLVQTGRDAGVHVKLAGSGGGVIGLMDGDPDQLARLRDGYERLGARFLALYAAPEQAA